MNLFEAVRNDGKRTFKKVLEKLETWEKLGSNGDTSILGGGLENFSGGFKGFLADGDRGGHGRCRSHCWHC